VLTSSPDVAFDPRIVLVFAERIQAEIFANGTQTNIQLHRKLVHKLLSSMRTFIQLHYQIAGSRVELDTRACVGGELKRTLLKPGLWTGLWTGPWTVIWAGSWTEYDWQNALQTMAVFLCRRLNCF